MTATVHGRAEICGNHTDHQHGRVIAATVAASLTISAVPNRSSIIRVPSMGVSVELRDFEPRVSERGTTAALIRGVAAYLDVRDGCALEITSDIPVGAGLSSSAAFEVALGRALRPECDALTLAKAGQYAETRYFGKPCGLMDQLIIAVGGTAMLNFANPDAPVVTPLELSAERLGLTLQIVNTGGSHADLSAEYAAIPHDMSRIAAHFGKTVLRDVDAEHFRSELPVLRARFDDRAVLRALHFFAEHERVLQLSTALDDADAFLRIIRESGESSAQCLQNIYASPEEQPLSVALAVARSVLGSDGAARVHGGGFAGGILAAMRSERLEPFHASMEALFGSGCCIDAGNEGRTVNVR